VVTDVADRYRIFSGGLKKGHPELKVCSRVYLLDAEGRHKKPEIYEVEYTTLRQAAVDHIRIAWTCLHAESLQELPNLLRMTEARGTQSGTTGE
jgi:hypothetical protein